MADNVRDTALIPEVLQDTVRAQMKGKPALLGSRAVIATAGLRLDAKGGDTVDLPFDNEIGEMVKLAEGAELPLRTSKAVRDQASVQRAGIAFSLSMWKRIAEQGDAYTRFANKCANSAQRLWDSELLRTAATSPATGHSFDVFNAGSPAYVTWQRLLQLRGVFGDEFESMASLVMHSKVALDLYGQLDSQNRPLLVDVRSDSKVGSIAGLPEPTITDRAPIAVGSIAATGTTPPTVTVTGFTTNVITGFRMEVTTGGALGTAIVKYSTDGGATWIENVATTGGTIEAIVKRNGDDANDAGDAIGLTINLAAGTYATNNVYVGTLKYGTIALLENSLLLWRNGQPTLEEERKPRKDLSEYALNTYFVTHRLRRALDCTRSGVAIYWTN